MYQGMRSTPPVWLFFFWAGYAALAPWLVRLAPGWRDGPEFIVSSQVLGIAHPSGFPLYSVLGWALQQLLPLGDIAMRNHLGNTAITLAAAVMLYSFASAFFRLFYGPDAPLHRHLAGFISMLWLMMPPQWENAIQAEVYALFALFIFIVLRLLVAYWSNRDSRFYLTAVFIAGLGCGVHATMGFLIFVFVCFLAVAPDPVHALRVAAKSFVAGIAGLAVYAYLPVRSLRDPPMDWGDTEHWIGFLHHVTDHKDAGSRFGQILAPQADTPYTVFHLIWNMSDWVGPALLLLSVAGWSVFLYRKFWPSLGLLLWLSFSFTFFSDWISATVLTACLGVLLLGLMPWIDAVFRWHKPIVQAALMLVMVISFGYGTKAAVQFLANRSDRLPREILAEEMLGLPYRATLLVGVSWFHVASLASVEGMRPDVSIIPLGDLISPQVYKPFAFSETPLLKPVPKRLPEAATPTGEEFIGFLKRLRAANVDRTRFFVEPDDGRNLRLFFHQLYPHKQLWMLWSKSGQHDCQAWQQAIYDATRPVFSESVALHDRETSDYFVEPFFGHVTTLIEQQPRCPHTAIGLIRWWQNWMYRDVVLQGAVFNDLGRAFALTGNARAARVMFQLGANIMIPEAMGNLGLWYERHGQPEDARKWLTKAFLLGKDVAYKDLRALSHQQVGR